MEFPDAPHETGTGAMRWYERGRQWYRWSGSEWELMPSDSLDDAVAEVNAARPGWEFGGCWQVTPAAWIAQAIRWNLVMHADFDAIDSLEADSLIAALQALAEKLRETSDSRL